MATLSFCFFYLCINIFWVLCIPSPCISESSPVFQQYMATSVAGATLNFIVARDESQGYLGFSTVMPLPLQLLLLPPLQRFPFGRDNLKNILVRPFKFDMGYIWAMSQMLLFCDLDLQFQGHCWPIKCQILAISHILAQFSHTESYIILWLVYIHIYVLCKHAES